MRSSCWDPLGGSGSWEGGKASKLGKKSPFHTTQALVYLGIRPCFDSPEPPHYPVRCSFVYFVLPPPIMHQVVQVAPFPSSRPLRTDFQLVLKTPPDQQKKSEKMLFTPTHFEIFVTPSDLLVCASVE